MRSLVHWILCKLNRHQWERIGYIREQQTGRSEVAVWQVRDCARCGVRHPEDPAWTLVE